MSIAISVQDVSKLYRLGEINRGQLLADIHRWWMKRFARKVRNASSAADAEPDEKGDFWALKEISFEIKQGETIGIVGANGAGKSTLLKIISRITAPTTGLVRIRGRIGSLLEVGTGFHPQLTGRDNVFLNGAILGMNRSEVKRKFDDIVAFAGLEQFIDTPVKRYSSGMYVRLAFSVAAFLEPEILIIDEVLSVGDVQFQLQCMQRMEEIIKDGRTLIFVSHGAGLVQRVCRRAIFLRKGRMIFDGDVDDALIAYAKSLEQEVEDRHRQPPTEVTSSEITGNEVTSNEVTNNEAASNEPPLNETTSNESAVEQPASFKEWPDLETALGDDIVKLEAVRIVNSRGYCIGNVLTTQSAMLEIEFTVFRRAKFLQPVAFLHDSMGNLLLWSTDTSPELRRNPMEAGRYKSSMLIPADFLAPGIISVSVRLIQIGKEIDRHAMADNVLSFRVIDDFSELSVRCGHKGPIPGFFRPRMKWTTVRRGI